MSNKKFWGTLLTSLLLSCGIPSFEYIPDPIITSSTDTFSIEIDIENSEVQFTYFEIYSRYFPENGTDSSDLLGDITLSEINTSVENFLENNGFSIVKYSSDNALTEDIEADLIDKIDISGGDSNISYIVTLDNDRVILSSTSLDEDYYLISTYNVTNESAHLIGDISDNMEEKLEKDYPEEYEKDQYMDIDIEFVVVNHGVSSSLTSIESLPVLVKNEFTIRN